MRSACLCKPVDSVRPWLSTASMTDRSRSCSKARNPGALGSGSKPLHSTSGNKARAKSLYWMGKQRPIQRTDTNVTQPATQQPKSTAKRRKPASRTLEGHRSSRSVTPATPTDLDQLPVVEEIENVTAESATADLDEAVQAADLVRSYLNEIGKVSLLNAVEEVELS